MSANAGTDLPKGERAILIAATQTSDPDGASREFLTVVTGYKKSTRDAYVLRLREKGLVGEGTKVQPTDAGIAALGATYEPMPTGPALRQWWLDRLPKGEADILRTLIDDGSSLTRDELSRVTGYKKSTRDAYILRLRSKLLVETGSNGVYASRLLF